MACNVPELTLNNGVKIPQVCFGTWRLTPEDAYRSVINAVRQGYRSVDTAAMYFNEISVGRALRDCGVPGKRDLPDDEALQLVPHLRPGFEGL